MSVSLNNEKAEQAAGQGQRHPKNRKAIFALLMLSGSLAFTGYMYFGGPDAPVNTQPVTAADYLKKRTEIENSTFNNTLSGKVTIETQSAGKVPLRQGTVACVGSGVCRQTTIGINGDYTISDIPSGPVRLLIATTIPPGRDREKNARTYAADGSLVKAKKKVATQSATPAYEELRSEDKGGLIKVYEKIDALYGKIASPKVILTDIVEGENTFNIELNLTTNSNEGSP